MDRRSGGRGLIRPGFAADKTIQKRRSLLRARKQPGRARASHMQRIRKPPEAADIKLDGVSA
jgi:hypothetical protein